MKTICKKTNHWLPFTLFLILLIVSCLSASLAAKAPQTAEELGYLPASELLGEDGKTIIFNDPAIERALKEQYAYLQEADGSFLKASLSKVTFLIIGFDLGQNWENYSSTWTKVLSNDLFIPEAETIDVSVLQFCTKITQIHIFAKSVESISALTQCKSLSFLQFIGTRDLSVDVFPSLSKLESLRFYDCDVIDFEPLTRCKKLSDIGIKDSQIEDISFVLNIPKLNSLHLVLAPNANLLPLLDWKSINDLSLNMENAQRGDISWQLIGKVKDSLTLHNATELDEEVLQNILPKLSSINLSYFEQPAEPLDLHVFRYAQKASSFTVEKANIKNLEFLGELKKLSFLLASNCAIQNADHLFTAPKLNTIVLSNLTIADKPSFGDLIKVTKFDTLRLINMELTDLSFVKGLTVESLYLNSNHIQDISPLTEAKKIAVLHLQGNPISDYMPLADIQGLKELHYSGTAALPDLGKCLIIQEPDGVI